jgi:sigma-B regulation protein RsbU (phosphoserine phosphatase)
VKNPASQKRRVSLRAKLILSIGFPLVAVYLAILAFAYWTLREDAFKDIDRRLTAISDHSAELFNGEFKTVAQVASSAAAFLGTQPGIGEPALYDLLKVNLEQGALIYGSAAAFEPYAFQADRELFSPYVWKKPDGVLGSIDIAKDAYDYRTWEWYASPKTLGKGVWTKPYFDEGAGNVVMSTYSAPFYGGETLRGIATIDVKLEDLQKKVMSFDMESDGFFIIGSDGVYISHPVTTRIMKESIFSVARADGNTQLETLGKKMVLGERGIARVKGLADPEPYLVAYSPIPSTGWSFASFVREDKVMAPVWVRLGQFGLVMIAGLLVILAVIRSYIEALIVQTSARESVENELRIARGIQLSLLPNTFPPYPHRKEFGLYALHLPAKHVAGDFFDFFLISKDELALVIADVSGKGMPAAMMMAVTRTMLRNLASSGVSPSEVLEKANQSLIEGHSSGLFLTLIFGIYHIPTGVFRYANAAHPAPYCVSHSKELRPFGEVTGTILGVFPEASFEQKEERVLEGDTIMFYTDGAIEARSSSKTFFGEKAFEQSLKENAPKELQQMCETVFSQIEDFQSKELEDDLTLFALRRNAKPRFE